MNSRPNENASICVDRESLYFDDGPSSFFGWYHVANSELQRDCAVVICSPVGYEYAHSHRSMRHLADRLAQHGIPAIRFDYHGIGDSPGTDLDADRWRCWQNNIKTAIQRARELGGRRRICLLGVRLGATLAALVASEVEVDFLVLWNPCVSGRRYLREIQAIASTGDGFVPDANGVLESAGFELSAETVAALRAVDLLGITSSVAQRALVVGRDDLMPEQSLSMHLTAMGVENDHVTVPGFAAMMAEPQFAIVPEAAFSSVINWVVRYNKSWVEPSSAQNVHFNELIRFPFQSDHGKTETIEERLCHFGENRQLFGILSRTTTATDYPAIILFNAGSVHHVGPNRLYVTLARNLCTLGFACFRFDLAGIGDSVLKSPPIRENHPYPDTAKTDAQAAIGLLKRQFGYTRFIALGLCSGAHTAFHVGLTFEHEAIVGLILINPLTFYWVEGMSLATTRQFQDVSYYKQSVRNPSSWRKLLRGNVNVVNLARVALSYFSTSSRSYYHTFLETIRPDSGSQLSRDLKRLSKMNRTLLFIIAEGDPGRDILMANARRTVSTALKTNQMTLQMISGADHTFTHSRDRKELIDCLSTTLVRQYIQSRKLR